MIPMTAPTAKSRMIPIRNSLTAAMIYVYFPNNNKMNAPEIPGKIMAQMAMAPESMMNHQV